MNVQVVQMAVLITATTVQAHTHAAATLAMHWALMHTPALILMNVFLVLTTVIRMKDSAAILLVHLYVRVLPDSN